MAEEALRERMQAAHVMARLAGTLALDYFARLGQLEVHSKGVQDYVTEADREVENLLRQEIATRFPADSVLGEEHGKSEGSNEYCWVVDPIDGTSNFVRGDPTWVVAIACVKDEQTELAVTYSPTTDGMHEVIRGGGAKHNGTPIKISSAQQLSEGVVGFGYSLRRDPGQTIDFIRRVFADQGLVFHNASGAAMLSHVADGRLLAYVEPHLNSWDCLGGLLMIEEAGGIVQTVDMATMLAQGGLVVVTCPGVNTQITAHAAASYGAVGAP